MVESWYFSYLALYRIMVNDAIDREIEGWQKFESIMYQEDQVLFDKMMSEAKQYLAEFPASKHDPAEMLFMTLIFQQQKIINKLLAVFEAKQKKG